MKRDYEYRRLGTISLLAAIDLLTGEAIPLVRDSHTADDFIDFLKILNGKYPKGGYHKDHSGQPHSAYIQERESLS